jgi:protein tyrosine/serine phosphatase
MFVFLVRRHNLLAAVIAALLLITSAAAETKNNAEILAKIHIKNFGRTNDNYFRGAQPDNRDYPDLAAIGVRTVIDLTQEGRSDEAIIVQRAGMHFYRIPLTTSDRPSEVAVNQFLKLVNDPANWPVYVHCQGGRHRTGVMTAVYRMTNEGWSANRAYDEMKQYHFEGFPGHPVLKNFVYDYYSKLNQTRQNLPRPSEKTSTIAQ